jgi:hypothetical protein
LLTSGNLLRNGTTGIASFDGGIMPEIDDIVEIEADGKKYYGRIIGGPEHLGDRGDLVTVHTYDGMIKTGWLQDKKKGG